MAVSGRKASDGLSCTMSRGSSEDFDLICQPCDRDDIDFRLPAFGFCCDCQEHLCESCFRHHKRAKPSRHHILVDKEQMPQTQHFSTFISFRQSDDFTKPCPKHMKELIKFYCHDHRVLLCSVCVTLEYTHKGCRINYIPDISDKSLDSKEYRHILKRMDILTRKCNKITADLKQMIAKSSTSLTDALAEIKKFRHDLNQRLDKLEKRVVDKAKTIQQENDISIQTVEATCNDVIKSTKASADVIKQLNTSKHADRLFMELHYAEQMIQEHEKKLTSPSGLTDYHFQPNSAILTCLKNEKFLGSIKEKSATPSITCPADAFKSRQFSHQGEINVKSSEDKVRCWITGMAFIMPSKVILTDRDNMSIKMVDINSNSITHHLKLDTIPWEITPVTRDHLAVTLPFEKTIQFISFSSNKLTLKHTLKVDGKCCGISYCHKKLVVTFDIPPKLEIIDLKGRTLITVTTNSSGENTFGLPLHVISNSSAIYVADETKSKVFMFNWQGEPTGSYDGLDRPQDVTMLQDGSILVSECNKGSIHHISGDLTKGKVLLKNLKNSHAVCWCYTNSQLCISSFRANDNFIQLFKKI